MSTNDESGQGPDLLGAPPAHGVKPGDLASQDLLTVVRGW